MIITANELKVKGVSLLDSMFEKLDEVLISVRGKNKYVVVDIARYEYLRECELEQAYREVKEDIQNGDYDTMSVEEHMKELKNALSD
ncbi:MAG: HigA protein (antitoxin to HigB) [uncultured Sulfurovum sp.]|uniref:HigA protein (Antitoxin to HigB) n=1 Tax=uncultured Sulfurovum sp. TaxID=269237 RepID=A0A6S6T7S4_9BACT|nr:MAG: HigA protein (antitoxin to HigB) [uncultured Sulfurovum sp.]